MLDEASSYRQKTNTETRLITVKETEKGGNELCIKVK